MCATVLVDAASAVFSAGSSSGDCSRTGMSVWLSGNNATNGLVDWSAYISIAILVSPMIELPSSNSAATEIRCCPGPKRFSKTTTHSPFESAVVLPSNSLSSNTLIIAPGGALPATTAAPSGFTRAISMFNVGGAIFFMSTDGVSDVTTSSCGAGVSSTAALFGASTGLAGTSIDWVCGATSAVSSSLKKTMPRASATSTPPTPKSM